MPKKGMFRKDGSPVGGIPESTITLSPAEEAQKAAQLEAMRNGVSTATTKFAGDAKLEIPFDAKKNRNKGGRKPGSKDTKPRNKSNNNEQ